MSTIHRSHCVPRTTSLYQCNQPATLVVLLTPLMRRRSFSSCQWGALPFIFFYPPRIFVFSVIVLPTNMRAILPGNTALRASWMLICVYIAVGWYTQRVQAWACGGDQLDARHLPLRAARRQHDLQQESSHALGDILGRLPRSTGRPRCYYRHDHQGNHRWWRWWWWPWGASPTRQGSDRCRGWCHCWQPLRGIGRRPCRRHPWSSHWRRFWF